MSDDIFEGMDLEAFDNVSEATDDTQFKPIAEQPAQRPETSQEPTATQASEIEDPLQLFVLDLVKALVQVGYYTSDHPHAQGFLQGLHESFAKALGDRQEIAFIRREVGTEKDIIVDGYLVDDDISLLEVLPKEVGHLFLPKLIEFYERSKLLIFSIKANVESQDFIEFINLMTEMIGVGEKKGELIYTGHQVSEKLQRRGVTSISVVVEEHLAQILETLPWRVKMSLARLKRDLSVIPYFTSKDETEINNIQAEIIRDVMRPVRDPEYAADVLFYLDIVKANSGFEDLKDLEGQMIMAVPDEVRSATVAQILKIIRSAAGRTLPNGVSLSDRGREVLSKMIPTLKGSLENQSTEILKQMYLANMLTLEELPESAKKVLYEQDAANRFAQNPEPFLRQFNQCKDKEEYSKLAKQAVNNLQILVRQEQLVIAALLAGVIEHHCQTHSDEFPERLAMAKRCLEYLFSKCSWYQEVFALAGSRKPKDHEAILKIAKIAGVSGMSILADNLATFPEESARQEACLLLAELGDITVPIIATKLEDDALDWAVARYLVRTLGMLNDPAALKLLRQQVNHDHPNVRAEAMQAIEQSVGDDSEKEFVLWLGTSHEDVMIKVIEVLSAVPQLSLNTVKILWKRILNTDDPKLRARLINLLSRAGNVQVSKDKHLEDLVGEWLAETSSAWQKIVTTCLEEEPERAACSLLAKVGTKKSKPIITKLKGSIHPEIKRHAASALKHLDKRLKSKA